VEAIYGPDRGSVKPLRRVPFPLAPVQKIPNLCVLRGTKTVLAAGSGGCSVNSGSARRTDRGLRVRAIRITPERLLGSGCNISGRPRGLVEGD
jgi:hypothetical protein